MKAYLTIGMPASGKTTWAEQQKEFININLDDCRSEVCGDAGNHESTPQAVILHDQKIRQAAAKGFNIVISDTNLNPKYRDLLVQKLIDLGYEIEYALFPISLEVAKERNKKRSRVVPEHIIAAMFKNFQETSISGKILLGDTLISNVLIGELNQLANLEILDPSSKLRELQEKLLELELIILDGSNFGEGPKLVNWLQARGLLHLSLIPYLSSHIEDVVNEKFSSWPSEVTLSSLSELCYYLFSASMGTDKELSVASDLMQNKSVLKTCFNEKGELVNPSKLAEIIKEILK